VIAAPATAAVLLAIAAGATVPGPGTVEPGTVVQAGQSGQLGAHSRASAGLTVAPPDSTLAAAVAEYLRRLEAFGFSGAVLVGRGDDVIHASGHGLADREAGRPFATSTVSSLGSVTKVYTAAAILRLVGRGEVALSDTLGAFVPRLPADRSGITLRQLLTHTSGLGEAPYPDETAVSRERLLEEARTLPLLDEPGVDRSYSNLGFSLLGIVLEERTGLAYEEALRREVLRPARAWETGYTMAGWEPGRVAAGYERGERWGTIVEKFANPDGGPSWVLRANGGLHATVFDVFRFVRAYVDGAIAPPALVAVSMEPQGRFAGQGLGWALREAPDGSRAMVHDGSNGYLTASVEYLIDHDLTVIVLANLAEITAMDVALPLRRLATGAGVYVPPSFAATPLPDERREALAGTWEVAGGRLRAVDGGDHLQLHLEGQDLVDRALGADPVLAATLRGDTERTRRVVEAALRGEFADAPTLGRVWSGLEARLGPIAAVEVLGSAPVWYASPRASWIRLRFREGGRTQVRRLHWSADGTLYGIGGSVYPAPVSLRCIGSGPDTCTAVHLNLPTVPIRFGAAGGSTADLQVADLRLSARRSVAPENQMD